MNTVIFQNENKVSTKEVLGIFKETLEDMELFEQSEIEELSDILAKNPVDKFIVSTKPTNVCMQGDLLIWSDLTKEYKENFPKVTDLQLTDKMVLQDGDSLTGDHRLVPLRGANFTLKTGKFIPSILKNASINRNSYDCKILEIDTPFVITHREHGNMTLAAGKYMICSSLDSETLEKMKD
jgi:hypothetical protein